MPFYAYTLRRLTQFRRGSKDDSSLEHPEDDDSADGSPSPVPESITTSQFSKKSFFEFRHRWKAFILERSRKFGRLRPGSKQVRRAASCDLLELKVRDVMGQTEQVLHFEENVPTRPMPMRSKSCREVIRSFSTNLSPRVQLIREKSWRKAMNRLSSSESGVSSARTTPSRCSRFVEHFEDYMSMPPGYTRENSSRNSSIAYSATGSSSWSSMITRIDLRLPLLQPSNLRDSVANISAVDGYYSDYSAATSPVGFNSDDETQVESNYQFPFSTEYSIKSLPSVAIESLNAAESISPRTIPLDRISSARSSLSLPVPSKPKLRPVSPGTYSGEFLQGSQVENGFDTADADVEPTLRHRLSTPSSSFSLDPANKENFAAGLMAQMQQSSNKSSSQLPDTIQESTEPSTPSALLGGKQQFFDNHSFTSFQHDSVAPDIVRSSTPYVGEEFVPAYYENEGPFGETLIYDEPPTVAFSGSPSPFSNSPSPINSPIHHATSQSNLSNFRGLDDEGPPPFHSKMVEEAVRLDAISPFDRPPASTQQLSPLSAAKHISAAASVAPHSVPPEAGLYYDEVPPDFNPSFGPNPAAPPQKNIPPSVPTPEPVKTVAGTTGLVEQGGPPFEEQEGVAPSFNPSFGFSTSASRTDSYSLGPDDPVPVPKAVPTNSSVQNVDDGYGEEEAPPTFASPFSSSAQPSHRYSEEQDPFGCPLPPASVNAEPARLNSNGPPSFGSPFDTSPAFDKPMQNVAGYNDVPPDLGVDPFSKPLRDSVNSSIGGPGPEDNGPWGEADPSAGLSPFAAQPKKLEDFTFGGTNSGNRSGGGYEDEGPPPFAAEPKSLDAFSFGGSGGVSSSARYEDEGPSPFAAEPKSLDSFSFGGPGAGSSSAKYDDECPPPFANGPSGLHSFSFSGSGASSKAKYVEEQPPPLAQEPKTLNSFSCGSSNAPQLAKSGSSAGVFGSFSFGGSSSRLPVDREEETAPPPFGGSPLTNSPNNHPTQRPPTPRPPSPPPPQPARRAPGRLGNLEPGPILSAPSINLLSPSISLRGSRSPRPPPTTWLAVSERLAQRYSRTRNTGGTSTPSSADSDFSVTFAQQITLADGQKVETPAAMIQEVIERKKDKWFMKLFRKLICAGDVTADLVDVRIAGLEAVDEEDRIREERKKAEEEERRKMREMQRAVRMRRGAAMSMV